MGEGWRESPQSALQSLVAEGYEYLKNDEKGSALDKFSKVLARDPDNLPARLGQAMVYSEWQRHPEAFAAYDEIVRSHPRNAFAWNGRGLAAFNMENFEEALLSFQKATVDQPVNGFFYESLAWTHLCRGDFRRARDSAKLATLMYNQKGESSAYPLLIAYFSSAEAGDTANARRTLNYALKNKPSQNTWPHPVFDYLANRMSAAELIAHVSDLAQETEAHTYIGLKLRLRGDHAEASRHLSWVAEKGDARVFEFTVARALQPEPSVAVMLPEREWR